MQTTYLLRSSMTTRHDTMQGAFIHHRPTAFWQGERYSALQHDQAMLGTRRARRPASGRAIVSVSETRHVCRPILVIRQ